MWQSVASFGAAFIAMRAYGPGRAVLDPWQPNQAVVYEYGANISDFWQVFYAETPTGTPLLAGLTFKVESGRHLVICGHNGAGKSSIFRCLAGLWPVAKGTITCPNACSRDVYYLSQRPMNIVGTLSDQLTYPTPVPGGLSAQDLRREEADWGSRLSLSEQQRLGIARVLYHRPKFAVLDECTSAVSKDLEHWLFQASPKRLFSRSAVLSE
eukprot:g2842.t1